MRTLREWAEEIGAWGCLLVMVGLIVCLTVLAMAES